MCLFLSIICIFCLVSMYKVLSDAFVFEDDSYAHILFGQLPGSCGMGSIYTVFPDVVALQDGSHAQSVFSQLSNF